MRKARQRSFGVARFIKDFFGAMRCESKLRRWSECRYVDSRSLVPPRLAGLAELVPPIYEICFGNVTRRQIQHPALGPGNAKGFFEFGGEAANNFRNPGRLVGEGGHHWLSGLWLVFDEI